MKTPKIIVVLLLLIIAVSFPLSLPNLVIGEAAAKSAIQSYGYDAQTFASALQEKSITSKVIVISDTANIDLVSTRKSLANGTTLVAMNLPLNNPLTDVPTLQLQENQTYYRQEENSDEKEVMNSTTMPVERVYPKYWITVIKHGPPLVISHFLAVNDTQECKEKVIANALDATATTKVHLPGVAPERTTTSSAPIVSAALLPGYSFTDWTHVAELDYTLTWNAQDFVTAQHSIYQTNYGSTVTNREYWLVASYFESQFGTYGEHYYGYYISLEPEVWDITNQITGNIPYDQYPGLLSHGPGTTPQYGTATIGFDFDVTKGGGYTVGVSYSYSWNVGPNRYDVSANPTGAYVQVMETLYGDSCHNNHYTWQTAVFQTPIGSGFDISDLRTTWDLGSIYIIPAPWGGYIFQYNHYYWTAIWNPARLYGPLDNAPSSYYVSANPYPATYTYGTAGVENPSGLIGSSSDWSYARLYATSYHAMAHLRGTLNAQAPHGRIVIDGYSATPNSLLLVYVSTDNSNWHQVGGDIYIFGSSHYLIDCGYYSSAFRYVLLVAYDNGADSDIHVDSLKVMPS